MEELDLDIQPEFSNPNRSITHRILTGLLGGLNIILGFGIQSDLRFISLGGGIVAIAYALFYHRIYKSSVYSFTEQGIQGPLTSRRVRTIPWGDISHVASSMFQMVVSTKAGSQYTINLENLTFRQHQELKPKVLELVKSKGIEVREA